MAWAQRRGITEVEVRVDNGPWEKATLGPDGGTDYWRQWFWVWDAKPGYTRKVLFMSSHIMSYESMREVRFHRMILTEKTIIPIDDNDLLAVFAFEGALDVIEA